MTKKLYDLDSYLKDFKACVLSCTPVTDGPQKGMLSLILDCTAFFPEGGGQSADIGSIITGNGRSFQVCDVRISGDDIVHFIRPDDNGDGTPSDASCDPDSFLPPGSMISGCIDFNTRFDRMQQHSGEHLLSGYVHRTFGYANVGFHLSDEVTTVDFDGTFTDRDIKDIERAVNEAIFKNLKCTIYYPSPEELEKLDYRSKKELSGAVRIVVFEGMDTCACCAPHVKLTGEIGLFKILSAEHFRGGTRMTIVCGMRALKAFTAFQDNAVKISQLLSVRTGDVYSGVERLKSSESELRYEMIHIEKKWFADTIRNIQDHNSQLDRRREKPVTIELPVIFTEKADPDNAREAVNLMLDSFTHYCSVFTGSDDDGYSFVIGSKDRDCRELMNRLKEHFSASGGGKPGMIQGRVRASRQDLAELIYSDAVQMTIIEHR